MPLIIISGFPCSGKSTRAEQLRKFFSEKKKKKVYLITENFAIPKAGFQKNEYFSDSQKEKLVRSDLKSETFRLLNKEDVIILDAGNYIKGYRYELFCGTKTARTNQCTLFCGIQIEKAWEFNQSRIETEQNLKDDVSKLNNTNIAYTRDTFDTLCMRFEEPHNNCRWDSPLFVCFPDDQLEFEKIYNALFSAQCLPPNSSTQNAPLSSTNYLFEMDKLTQQIVNEILSARKCGILGPVTINGTDLKVNVPQTTNAMQLNRLRRQFLNYTKMHSSSSSLDKIIQLFIQFLNSNFNK